VISLLLAGEFRLAVPAWALDDWGDILDGHDDDEVVEIQFCNAVATLTIGAIRAQLLNEPTADEMARMPRRS
jgi:hypothetical protein